MCIRDRITSADDAPASLADAAGDPGCRGWTLCVDSLETLPAGIGQQPRDGLWRRHVSRSGRSRERHLEILERRHRRALLLVTHIRGRLVRSQADESTAALV